MWGLEIFGGEVADALGCKVFVLRIILPAEARLRSSRSFGFSPSLANQPQ